MKYVLWIAFALFSSLPSPGQGRSDVVSKLDSYLESAHHAHHFNGVALIIHHHDILLNKGYGFSNMSLKTPNTPDTRFPLLSITKSFTSTVVLKLQEEKKLSVDDKLEEYFPEYPNGSKITIHHLLTHSSVIYDYTVDVGAEDSAIVNYPISKERVVSHFRDKPTDFSPGKSYSYSNSGYFLLGLIIEKVTGKPYETVVKEYIFNPLGMTQSGFDYNSLPQPLRAQGYEFWDADRAVPYKHFDSTFAYSTGAIYSTSNDMARWANAVSSRKLLTPETWELAVKTRIENYGYGWQTGEYSGRKYVRHSGGYPGYMSEFIYYPNENLIIVLLNNYGTYGQNVWSVGMGITSVVLGLPYDHWKERREVSVDGKILQSHTGTYRGKKDSIRIKLENDKLFAEINGRFELKLYAEDANHYFFRDFNTTLHFDNGILTIHEHGSDSEWRRK